MRRGSRPDTRRHGGDHLLVVASRWQACGWCTLAIVVWFRRRRYDPRDYYRYRRRPVGGSCLRDACLLDVGCCLGESLSDNCLVLTLLALPQMPATMIAEVRTRRREHVAAGPKVTALLISGIRTYQREVSPRRAPCCHFPPTCSEYAAQAIQIHGARRGSWLTIKRLGRCRPGRPTTDDPVPLHS